MSLCLRTAETDEDLIALWLHIAADNPVAADKLLERMAAVFQRLAAYPRLGALRHDLAPDLRHFVVGSYLILYREIRQGVEIVRVVHGARYVPHLI